MARRRKAITAACLVAGILCVTLSQSGASAEHRAAGPGLAPVIKAPASLRLTPKQARHALKPPVVQRVSRARRFASRGAYRNLSDRAARMLARTTFSLATPRSRLALDEPGVRVVRPVGDYASVVSVGRQRAVTVSSLPLTARDKTGRKTRASLQLESHSTSYAPKAALVPLRISKRLRGGIVLAGNIRVQPLGTRDSTARRVGQTAFFANTTPDTDVLVQAAPQGAEIFWQLRSDRSAEQHRLRFTLPTGATLRMSDRMPGSAEIVAGGRTQLTIPPPTAHDADGEGLPLTMHVAENVLTVTARHTGRGLHYPILVDPALNGVVRENYGDFYNPGNAAQAGFPNFTQIGGSPPFGFATGAALQVYGFTGVTNSWGVYSIQAPGSAQIYRADIDNAYFLNPSLKPAYFYAVVGPSAAGQTNAWTTNAYNGTSSGAAPLLFPLTFGPMSFTFCAGHVDGMSDNSSPGFCTPGAGAPSNYFQVGVYTASSWASGNYLTQVGGASVTFTDSAPPTNVALASVPTGWVTEAPANVAVSAQQGGLGIGAFSVIDSAGAALLPARDLGCYVNNSTAPSQSGATSTTLPPCPQQASSGAFDLASLQLPEGVNAIRGTAQSITGVSANSAEGQLKIDRTSPDAVLSGTLPTRFGSSITDARTLHVDAPDRTASVATSGTTDITVKLDSAVVARSSGTCPAGDCARSLDYTFAPGTSAVGPHTITITVTDAAGNTAQETHRLKVLRPRITGAPGTVDLFGGAMSTRMHGAAANDRFGAAVAYIGDMNADGITDSIVGAPGASPSGRQSAGAAYVIFGAAGPRTLDVNALTASQGFKISGGTALDSAGTAVAGVGDVNGDAIPDVAVGAPRDAAGSIQLLKGAVYIVFGQGGTPANVDLGALGSRGFRIDGPLALLAGKHFGSVIASPAPPATTDETDLNGDGKSDILLGDPSQAHDLLRLNSGSAYVVFGKADSATVDAAALGTGGRRIDGPVGGGALGSAVAFAGDQNDDDVPDIALGAPGANAAGRTAAGSAFVIYGSNFTAPLDLAGIGTNGYTVRGANGQRIGGSLVRLGDENNDANDELGLGGRTPAVLRGDLDRVGATVDLAGTFPGYLVQPPASFPAAAVLSISTAPDIDGDLIDDLVLLAPGAPPRYWSIFGRSDDRSISLAALDSSEGFPIAAANAPAISAVGAGERVTADTGVGTLAGIPQAAPLGRTGAGEAYVVTGPQPIDDCINNVSNAPTSGTSYVWCDGLGKAYVYPQNATAAAGTSSTPAPLSAPLATPRLAAAAGNEYPADGSFPKYFLPQPGIVGCEKKTAFKCEWNETHELKVIDWLNRKVRIAARVRTTALMRLNGRRIELQMSLQAKTRNKPIKQVLGVRCRIDHNNLPDATCSEGPEFRQQADIGLDPAFSSYNSRKYFAHDLAGGRTIYTYYPANSAKRFLELAYLEEIKGEQQLLEPTDFPYWRTFHPFSPQTVRFKCRASGDEVVCAFV
jgi:hypothetical protein